MASESDSTSQSDVSSSESEAGEGESLELGSSDLTGAEEERRGLRSRQGKLRIRGEFDSYVPSNS